MSILNKPITTIPKIGPKTKALLEKLEIATVEDLLYHFPFRYEDYSVQKNIADLEEGDTVTVKATLTSIENIFTRYRKRLTKGKIQDETGSLTVIWFNQHFIKNVLKEGNKYKVSGKVSVFDRKPVFISPEFDPVTTLTINTGRLVPVYPETAGVSSKWIRYRINDIFNQESDFREFLPDILINKHHLIDFDTALKKIHFPVTLSDASLARKRFEFEEIFLELLKVEKRKEEWNKKLKGLEMEYESNSEKISGFVKSLPFRLTESQKVSAGELIEDMCKPHPMNRLLEGDVGTGKTVIAIIAAYFTSLNGYRTLYLAPTEILANQHYTTFREFLTPLGLKIDLITGSHKPKNTEWDILIGTHALFFNDINYEKIGFAVVDEQHRFGVEQRAKLLNMNKGDFTPHLLTMTATPIPRTLALTLFGDLGISILKTAPNINKKITTTVIPEKQRQETYELIKRKNEPTFIVCPLIEESESASMENVKAAQAEFETLKEGVFKDVPIGLLHGRMKPKEKQGVIEQFKKGAIKVLVSTPVIEVGIDIPEATIMVIESAERYGLASLHQLRGRVGRGDKPGYCLIFMSNNSRSAYSRLKHLEKTDNGMELAELDMKIRGQGDIYGTIQHGFKKFKIADISNLELLEQAKEDAQQFYTLLDDYPSLKEKLENKSGKLVGKN